MWARAQTTFQSGDLPATGHLAEAGYKQFLDSAPEWAGRFRILQFQAMMPSMPYDEALVELDRTPSRAFATCELAAHKELLKAYAQHRLAQYSAMETSLKLAERPCPGAGAALQADVATMRGQTVDGPADAERDYMSALALARLQHDSFREAAALLNLSNAALSQEHYDESLDWGQASLRISTEKGYHRYEEKVKGNLAFNYEMLGQFDQAIALFQSAADSAHSLAAGDDQLRWQNNLGALHEAIGQLEAAKADYRQAYVMAQRNGDSNQKTIGLAALESLSIRTGDWAQAESLNQQLLEAARQEQNRPLELSALLARGLIAAHNGDGKTAEALLVQVARDPGHERQASRWEAQAALAKLYAQEGKVAPAEAEYSVALGTIRQARCSIKRESLRMPFLSSAARIFDSYIDFLIAQGKNTKALKVADESRALTLAEGLGIDSRKCLAEEENFAPIQISRQAKATVLFYWLGSEHSYLWAISPQRLKLYPLPAAAEIETSIADFRKVLTGPRDVLDSHDATGTKLYSTLVAPAEEFFRSDGRVIVITDGSLSGLSFETLIAPHPHPHYWIEDVTLENASSLRLLASPPTRRRRGSPRLLLMGNSKTPEDGQFAALPHAEQEMRTVGKYFADADRQVYEHAASTPRAYASSRPEQYDYIHFVAHGTASQMDPLDSAVVLSQDSAGGAYKLYARDVMAHPLQAELVTVSTCKGAGVKTYAGEGLVGLSWAFLHAGAHHVIGALWDVSDEATPQLMDRMYAELRNGKTPGVALRAAKLSLLHSGPPFRKPYYWAAFQLYTGP